MPPPSPRRKRPQNKSVYNVPTHPSNPETLDDSPFDTPQYSFEDDVDPLTLLTDEEIERFTDTDNDACDIRRS